MHVNKELMLVLVLVLVLVLHTTFHTPGSCKVRMQSLIPWH